MNNFDNILKEFNAQFLELKSEQQLDEIRVKFLGKKGLVTELFAQLKNIAAEEKKAFGAAINKLRDQITSQIDAKKELFGDEELNRKLSQEKIDITEPVRKQTAGFAHPISKVIKEIREIFAGLGFEFAEGPEIENDFYNFTALNMPPNHPARQMQDTFYLQQEKNSASSENATNTPHETLLRTHTSTVQIRKMLSSKPPLRVVALGRVFRRDSDQTHTPMFHQIEGFVVDETTNMAHLKWVLEEFLRQFFEVKNVDLRFRPSFFPFTEPSAEVDIGYKIDQGRIKIGSANDSASAKFMEILGCGMIHPNVLKNCEIDPEKFQGFAFGIGIERLAMLKYGITDLRMFFENDARFLQHYGFKGFEF